MTEQLVMVTRDPAGAPPEAEPVLVLVDDRSIVLVLDDGERLVFDAAELRRATTPDLRAAA